MDIHTMNIWWYFRLFFGINISLWINQKNKLYEATWINAELDKKNDTKWLFVINFLHITIHTGQWGYFSTRLIFVTDKTLKNFRDIFPSSIVDFYITLHPLDQFNLIEVLTQFLTNLSTWLKIDPNVVSYWVVNKKNGINFPGTET